MRPVVAAGYILVPLFGVFMCFGPLVTRPAVQFGVRVPPGHTEAPVIRQQRRSYRWRSAVIAIGAAAALIAWGGHRSWVPGRLILLVELTADVGCFWWAHRRIAKVKSAEGWFAGRRQTVVVDTSWRTEPQPFPIGWLAPAVAVIVATVVIGVFRYPHLPAYLDRGGGHRVATSPVSAFAVVLAQVYATALWAGVLALVYRSRPDLDTSDPAASLRNYRTALGMFGRAGLVLLACVDLSLLLHALQIWQLLHLAGGGDLLMLVPFALGLLAFFCAVIRAGAVRARVPATAAATDRDDDRFWKAGIVYVNRGDPAVLVGARVAFGWTLNLANPTAWLLMAGFLAVPAGFVALGVTTGI
jgi:uncharacterized membrane protein